MRCLALALVIPTLASLTAFWKSSQGPLVSQCNHVAYADGGGAILVLDRNATVWSGVPADNVGQSSWDTVDVQGIRPAPRLSPVTAFSTKRNTLIVWGGERSDPSGYLSDLYTYNTLSRSWSQPQRRLMAQPERRLLTTKGKPNADTTPMPEYRDAQSGDVTVGGCVCMALWQTNADVCGGHVTKTFNGCGMAPPCDGDNGGVADQSWCLVRPSASCKSTGQDWDYCVINVPLPPASTPDASRPTLRPSARSTPRPAPTPRPVPTPPPTQRYIATPSPTPGLSPTVSPTIPPTLPPTIPPTLPPTIPPTLPPTIPPTLPPTIPPTLPPTIPPTLPPTLPPTIPPTVPLTIPAINFISPTLNSRNLPTPFAAPQPTFSQSNSLAGLPSSSPTTYMSRIIRNTPVARGWTQFCWTSDDETVLFLYGGAGSYDGNYGSNLDVSLADAWMLDTTSWSWSPLSTMVGYSLASNGTRLDLQNAVVAGLTGHRLGRVNRTIYIFGGYACRKNAQTLRGGPDCFVDSMYGYLVDQRIWFKVEESGFWPAGRAYHSLTVMGSQLWMFGGNSMNSFGAWEFFQDVAVFDTKTLRWAAVKATDPQPSARWGHVAVRWLDGLWMYGGCATDTQSFSDAFTLSVVQAITADNVQASGPGLRGAVSGENTSFVIDIRDSYPGPSGLQVFGDPIRAPGLIFDITVSPQADVSILFTGDHYEVSFIAPRCACSTYTVTVKLNGENVYGSPFLAGFLPEPLVVTVSVNFDQPQSPDALRDVSNALCNFGATRFNVSLSALQCTLGPASRRRLLAVAYDFTITAPSNASLNGPLTSDDFTQDALVSRALRDARGSIVKVEMTGGRRIVSPPRSANSDSLEAAANMAILVLNIIFICVLVPCFFAAVFQEVRGVRLNASGTSLICFGGILALIGNFFVPGNNDTSCHVASWLLGLGFTMLLTGLLVRSMRVTSKKGKPRSHSLLLCVGLGLILIDLIINILWQALDPQFIILQPWTMCKSNTGVFEWIASVYVFVLAIFVLMASLCSWCTSRLTELANVCAASLNFVAVCIILLIIRIERMNRDATVLVYALGIIWAVMFTVGVVCFPVICRCGKSSKHVEGWKQPQSDPPPTHIEMQPVVKAEERNPILETNQQVAKDEERERMVPEASQVVIIRPKETEEKSEQRPEGFREQTETREASSREGRRVSRERREVSRERREVSRERKEGRETREKDEREPKETEHRIDISEQFVLVKPAPARSFQTPARTQSARKHYHISRRTDRQERRERRERSRPHRREALSPSRRELPREDHGLLQEPGSPIPLFPQASSPLPDIDYFRKKDKVRVHRSHSHHGHRSRRHEYPPTAPRLTHSTSFQDFPSTPLFSSAFPHKYPLPEGSLLDTEPVRIRYTFKELSPHHSTGSNTTAITFEDLNLDFMPDRQRDTPSNVLAPREWKGHRHSLGSSIVTFS